MTLRHTFERIATRSKRAFALARIRYRIRRVCSHPDAVHIEISDGVAEVTGPVLAPEYESVVVAAASVPGVISVRDRLSSHVEADVSELQNAPLAIGNLRKKWLFRIARGALLLFGLGLAWQASRLRRH
jgi:hypothetical protein